MAIELNFLLKEAILYEDGDSELDIRIMLHSGLEGHDYVNEEPIFQGSRQESLDGCGRLHPLHPLIDRRGIVRIFIHIFGNK